MTLLYQLCLAGLCLQQIPPSAQPIINRVMLTKRAELGKTDLRGISDLDSFAVKEGFDIFRSQTEIILIDRKLIESDFKADLLSLSRLVEGIEEFPYTSQAGQLPPDQAKAIQGAILRSPFAGAYSQKALNSVNLQFGIKISFGGDFLVGGKSRNLHFGFGMPKSYDEKVDNPDLPFGAEAIRAKNLEDDIAPNAPLLVVVTTLARSRTSESALVAKATQRLSDLIKLDEEKAKKIILKMAERALGKEPPSDGSRFSDWPQKVQDQLLAEADSNWLFHGFASAADARQYLTQSRLLNVKFGLSISVGVMRNGQRTIQSFSLDSIRY
ncbi:MAG TPA: hypothetical protein VJ835_10320 [Fimbriimonadaceae bacterium]|nr:hypothetical protein [Fimbriimonadaceae bacterium]